MVRHLMCKWCDKWFDGILGGLCVFCAKREWPPHEEYLEALFRTKFGASTLPFAHIAAFTYLVIKTEIQNIEEQESGLKMSRDYWGRLTYVEEYWWPHEKDSERRPHVCTLCEVKVEGNEQFRRHCITKGHHGAERHAKATDPTRWAEHRRMIEASAECLDWWSKNAGTCACMAHAVHPSRDPQKKRVLSMWFNMKY